MIGKDLFRVLKSTYGTDFDTFIWSKITPLEGDISCIHLGLKDFAVKERLWNDIDIILNVAATTNFDER